MPIETERARDIARNLGLGNTWLDTEQATEIARLLEGLADNVEVQQAKLNSIEFALHYYSEPHLYVDSQPRNATDPILDGGLRARTALSLMKMRSSALARRVG
jgi:hypothetical protein